ncbi:ABC transporter permease [Oceanimonas baumannii]|uniref:ABC transporter permease n=2 Tax=Oceanimonas baumannii TaxID=129578 RepID=A0A235CL37_9GAMM|nr:ABC transporter permease [Oceanimonas baumannii]TDW62446.1 putative spermidine/putrescine transport system permease protein [Oceanimonas baumannii]
MTGLLRYHLSSLIMTLPTLLLMAGFFFLPLFIIFGEALQEPLSALSRLISDNAFWQSLLGSLVLAIMASGVSVAVGLMIAIYLAKQPAQLRMLWSFLVSLPLVFSGLIVAYGFILAFGRAGTVTMLMSKLGIDPAWLGGFIYSPAGLAFAYCYYLTPRAIFVLLPILVNFDHKQLLAGYSLGASRWQAFKDILLPQIAPALGTSICITFAVAFGAYGTALALTGTQVNILPLLLYSRISDAGSDFPVVALISIILLTVCLLITALSEWLKARADTTTVH